MLGPVLIYLLAINATAFTAFAIDKQRAVGGARRIPERSLLQMAAAGGVFGAVAAQRLLCHKTRKEPFRTQLLVVTVVEGAAAAFAVALWWFAHPS